MIGLATNMLSALMKFKNYVFGPRLFRIFPTGGGSAGRDYEPNNLEFFCDAFIRSVSYAISLSIYSSPIMAYYVYKKGMMTAGHVMYLSKVIFVVATSISVAHVLRGVGRYTNPDYRRFMQVLIEAKKDPQKKLMLQSFDFEFFAWPVDFKWNESDVQGLNINTLVAENRNSTFFEKIIDFPVKILEYVIAHGFARPMVYPGSVKLLQHAMAEPMKTGRAYLIEKNGLRAKIATEDGNEIDTMFLDRRNKEINGDTLVIASEGNAGFYELGCMSSPRNAGYSVLGWNHPGFAGSSGLPYPAAEQKAVDAVIKYAVTKLGFRLEDIVLFAWSIGGYAASYAAMTHPQVKAVILDATFDDVAPLAQAKMPELISRIVMRVIKNHFPLNIQQQLVRYPGPIRFIRRFQEEIITTQPYNPATNRGNFLLIHILQFRYPKVMTEESVNAVINFLSAPDFRTQEDIKARLGYNEEICEDTVKAYIGKTWPTFPTDLGQDWDAEVRTNVALFLVSKYMINFDATHCTPLPSTYLLLPWQH